MSQTATVIVGDLMSAHLVLKPSRPPRAEYTRKGIPDPESVPNTAGLARELVEAESSLHVQAVGDWDLFVLGSVSEFQQLFGVSVRTGGGGPYFEGEPVIPARWREFIGAVVTGPRAVPPI